jgi:hypothetical protein
LTGWSAGANATLLYTDNGGETWQRRAFSDTTAYINKILFLNSNTGFIGANSGKLFRTTDSGNTWEIYLTGTNYPIQYISFINPATGFISSTLGEIYKTTNTGTNWNLIKNFNGANYGDIHFFDENKGLISKSVYGVFDILMTTNGGIDWNSVFVPASDLEDFYFSDQNTGYVCGSAKIYKTTNGGLNWVQSYSINATVYSIYSNGDKVWACGSYGKILYSSNGGTNWQTQDSKTNEPLSGIIFLDSSVGYVCGGAGYIAKTTNSGTVFITKISNTIPSSYSLGQNYPNPFNPSTVIRFNVSGFPVKTSGNDKVVLKVYDVMGRELRTLVNERLNAGTYEVKFDGSMLTSGVYFYKMVSEGFTETKRMVLIK